MHMPRQAGFGFRRSYRFIGVYPIQRMRMIECRTEYPISKFNVQQIKFTREVHVKPKDNNALSSPSLVIGHSLLEIGY